MKDCDYPECRETATVHARVGARECHYCRGHALSLGLFNDSQPGELSREMIIKRERFEAILDGDPPERLSLDTVGNVCRVGNYSFSDTLGQFGIIAFYTKSKEFAVVVADERFSVELLRSEIMAQAQFVFNDIPRVFVASKEDLIRLALERANSR